MTETSRLDRLANGYRDSSPHVRELGLVVDSIAPGQVVCRLPYRDAWVGDPERQLIHTGIIITLVDSTAGLAVFSALPSPERIATLDLRMDYLRPSRAGRALLCESRCDRVTDNIAFVSSRVWQDGDADPVALGQASFMRTGGR